MLIRTDDFPIPRVLQPIAYLLAELEYSEEAISRAIEELNRFGRSRWIDPEHRAIVQELLPQERTMGLMKYVAMTCDTARFRSLEDQTTYHVFHLKHPGNDRRRDVYIADHALEASLIRWRNAEIVAVYFGSYERGEKIAVDPERLGAKPATAAEWYEHWLRTTMDKKPETKVRATEAVEF